MKQFKTQAIVLSRVNYQEADRIVTLLTPDHGKLRLMARGVRLLKSKLAGGIELFSVNDISFILGRGEVGTLISARLSTNFSSIITDINRVQFGYELLQMINKSTEDRAEADYFYLLSNSLGGLNDTKVSLEINRLWFLSKLLVVSGHSPDLNVNKAGTALSEKMHYGFDHSSMAFFEQNSGKYTANHIKYLRLVFGSQRPITLVRVNGYEKLTSELLPLIKQMHQAHLFG